MTTLLLLAVSFLGFGTSGTPAMALLDIGPGPRAGAMGEAGIALADDATALYWNPAGLARLTEHRLQLGHHQWFAGIHDETFNAAFPSDRGTFAFGLEYTAEPDIEYWSEDNRPAGTFSTWSGIAGIGYGVPITGEWHAGFGLKGFYQDLHTAMGFGGAAEVGVLGRPLPFLSLGVAARNLGIGYFGSDVEDLPTRVGVGAAYDGPALSAAVDAFYPFDGDLDIRGGVEYRPLSPLAVRAGYRTTPDLATLGWSSGLTAGLGITLGNFGLDYSVTPFGALGLAHRIGIRARAPRRGRGAVDIQVVDASTMAPFPARVVLSGIRAASLYTDRRGELRVTGLVRGRLVLRTSRDGFLPRADTLLILGDRTQYATIALKHIEYGSIWGVVYDAATGNPVGGSVAYRGPVDGESEAPHNSGSYTIPELPVGEYVLTAFGPTLDYVAETCTLVVRADRVTERDFHLQKRR